MDNSPISTGLPTPNPPPTIQDLNKHATPFIAAHWYNLGLELLNSQHREILEVIKRDNKGNVYRCCIRMFNKWLRTSDTTTWTSTWNQLIEATRRLDLGEVAGSIESSLLGLLYTHFSGKDKLASNQLLVMTRDYFDLTVKLIELGVPFTLDALQHIRDGDIALLIELWKTIPVSTQLQMKNQHKMTLLHEAVVRNSLIAVWKLMNESKRPFNVQLPLVDCDNREQQIRTYRRAPCDKESEWYTTLNMKNKDGWTPLHYAAHNKFVDVLQVLLMVEECDVTICNHVRQTAFHLAARKGHLVCLELLLAAAQCSQSLNSLLETDKNGWDLACHACAQDDVKVIEWLLRNMPQHADVNHSNKKGYTPLLIACYYQKIEILQFLLDHDQVKQTAVTTDGKTALHIAAMHDSVEIAQLLLSKGFNIDQDDENGETALHISYKKGSHQMWRLLLDRGANQSIKNKEGKCPEDLKYQDLKVPVEVKKRGKNAVEGYIAALRKGKKKMPRCKLMIVGEAGVGKTNLLNLLTGEEFVPKHEKTEGVDIDLVSTHDISTETWKKSTIELHEEYRSVAVDLLADQLHDSSPSKSKEKGGSIPDEQKYRSFKEQIDQLTQKYTRPPNKRRYKHERSHSTKLLNETKAEDVATMAFVTESQPELLQSFTPVAVPRITPPKIVDKSPVMVTDQEPQEAVPIVVPSEQSSSVVVTPPPRVVPDKPTGNHTTITDISIIREASKKYKQSKSTQLTLPLKLTSFDFAGQKHYKPMHHSFITSRAIYVIAFNARQLVSGDQTVVNRSIQEIKFWINSIRVYTNAKVVLVGTHRGPYDGAAGDDLTEEEKKPFPQLRPKIIDDINILLKNYFNEDHYNLEPFNNKKNMALVECSIRNDTSGANAVREKLHHLGDNYPGNKDDFPISYLRFETMITKKRNHSGMLLIPREEIEQCGKDCDIDECQVALDFFHDIGIIIDPRNLPSLFLSDEQMKPLHDVVLIKPQWLADVMKDLMNIDQTDDKLKPEGDDMQKALRRFEKKGKADKMLVLYPLWREYHNGSEKVFEQICLLLEAYGLIVPIQQSDCYYVPCKLPQTVKGIPIITEINCHKISVVFKDSLFPPFLLHHLMFLMYREQTPSHYLFSDKECFMEDIRDCQWWLKQNDNCDSIDVTIRTERKVRTILPAMLLLHKLLLRIVKELKEINYEIGMMAICTACKQEQFHTYINASLNSINQNESLQCSNCRNMENIIPNTTVIKSKNYKYEKTFSGFKEDLKLDQLDENVRHHLVKDFKKNAIPSEEALDSDESIVQAWFEDNHDDPWPFIVTSLSNYKDGQVTEYLVDKLKREMCYI